jgi:UDP-glucuronate decarboxylase
MTRVPRPPRPTLAFARAESRALSASELEVVVTGTRGWLGRATVDMLESALGDEFPSRVHLYGAAAGELNLRSGARVGVRPLAELPELRCGPHVLVHYAFATREQAAELGLERYLAANRGITALVAEYVERRPPNGMVVASSGAVYLGDDITTNPYGVLKQQDELIFSRLLGSGVAEGAKLVIPRVFNLSGPFINKADRYVLGAIINDILGGGPIRLSAARPVYRSYLHVEDLVELCFAALLGTGPAPELPFDTAGQQEVEVGELAVTAARLLGRPEMRIQRPRVEQAEPDRYVGDGSTMHQLAAACGIELKDFGRQIVDTARYLGA